MFHDSQAVLALSREENPTVFQKTLGLNDFYFGGDDFDYPLGNIQMVGKSQAPMFRGEKPRRDEARARVDARARSRGTRSTSGSRPRTCRGRRTGSRVDRDGNITLRYVADERRAEEAALRRSSGRLLGQLGMHERPPAPAASPT